MEKSVTDRRLLKEYVPLLVTVAAGLVCYGLFVNRGMGLPVLGYNISAAERVMQGEVPYRDFVYNYTPGVLWINAGLMELFSARVATVNGGLFAFKLATLLVLFLVARRLTSAPSALVPIALSLSWIGYKVIFRAYPTQYSMLFVLLGLIFLLKYDSSERRRWLLLCGAAIGVVLLFKQNVGLLLLGCASAAIVIREVLGVASPASGVRRMRDVAGKVALCWIGFGVVAAPVLLYLWRAGALGPMLEHFLLLGSEYREKRAVPLPEFRQLGFIVVGAAAICGIGLLAVRMAPRFLETFVVMLLVFTATVMLVPGRAGSAKNSASAAMYYLAPALVIVTLGVAAWQFWRCRSTADQRERWWRSWGPTLFVALFAFGAYMELYPRADYAHLVRILPPVFLLVSLLTARSIAPVTTFFQSRMPAPRRTAILVAGSPIVMLFILGIKDTWQPRFQSGLRFAERTPLSTERARGILVTRRAAESIDELARTIEDHTSASDYIFSFAPRGTAFYFLTGRRNPTRLVWWRSAGITRDEREEVLDKLATGVPRLVLIREGFSNARISASIDARYHRLALAGDVIVYDRND